MEFNCVSFFPTVPPMFWIPSQLEGAYLGQDVTLECHSEAYPKSINYWVRKNGNMLVTGWLIISGTVAYPKQQVNRSWEQTCNEE